MANPKKLKAWTRIQDQWDPFTVRKAFEEIQDAINGLFDIREKNTTPTATSIITNIFGTPSAHYSYPTVVDPSSQLFPDGFPVQFTRPVTILRCYMTCDPQIPASAATTFSLQNAPSSPTSTGAVTFASGATFAQSTTLNVTIGLGGKLYIKAPAVLNDVQRLNNIYIEFI